MHALHIRAKYTHEKACAFKQALTVIYKIDSLKKIMRLNLFGLRAWTI